ncbi:MAG: glycosyltransferase family 87 protein [Candidatus Omnitrophota bacterium]|nr:DUF2029 domain-containing protein [Candidatus Omnitrophota bacterium]MBU1928491.1 DUF2029 domain-containing protein [Candidatus Omnitrophota bacterium]MBU2035436.1 DUF2029 domain-containing protein [Candidatus Omnitrophota bacterium]MBU2257951.1 DUF2029 domain-containing protein [Candidatus Omnitrophota bacterium]
MDNDASKAAYLKYFIYLVVLFVLFTYLHDLTKAIFTSDFIDTRHYYVNSKLLQQGVDVWKISPQEYLSYENSMITKTGYSNYASVLHSMNFFLIFSPFTFMGFNLASVLWVITCQAALIISTWLVLTKIFGNLDIYKVISGLFLVFMFWPLREDLFIGQPNLLILLFFTLALLCFKNKKIFLAGIFLGLGVQIKELFIPVLLFCLCKRYWKALISAICVIFLIKLAAIFSFGIDKEISYWTYQLRFFSGQVAAGEYRDISSLSIFYLLYNLFFSIAGIKFVQALTILINLIVLTLAFRVRYGKRVGTNPDKMALEFSFFITLCYMVCPWVHETHLVVLFLPLVICWFYIIKGPVKKSSIILFIIAYLILGLKYAITSFPSAWSGPFAFLLSFKGIGYILLFILLGSLLRTSNEG